MKLELDAKGGGGFFTNYIIPGDFDIAQFSWVGDAFPLCCLTQIYTTDADSNFGKIGSPEIDAKIEQTLDELDPARHATLANELDKMIWAEGFSLPLFQSPGNVAVRSNLANFGPAGHRRPGLHQDRLHEVAALHACAGSTAGSADSTIAAAPIAPTSSRTPDAPGRRVEFRRRGRAARRARRA